MTIVNAIIYIIEHLVSKNYNPKLRVTSFLHQTMRLSNLVSKQWVCGYKKGRRKR